MRITSFANAERFSLNIYPGQTKCFLFLLLNCLGFFLTSITEGHFCFSLSFILIIICYCRKTFLFFLARSRVELFSPCVTTVEFPYIHIHLLFVDKKLKLNQHFVSEIRARCESIFFRIFECESAIISLQGHVLFTFCFSYLLF